MAYGTLNVDQIQSSVSGVSLGAGNSTLAKNRLINGSMYIAQRATSATITAGAALNYATVDRFYAYCTGANVTMAQVSGSGNIRNLMQFTGAASVTAIGVGQRIESVNSYDLAGSPATFSVQMANSLLTSVTWTAYYANTTDSFGTLASPTRTQIATGTFTVNSTLSTYSATFNVPSAATTGIEIVLTVGAQTSGTWQLTNWQLEVGSVATGFEYRMYQQELALCQRYFIKYGGNAAYEYVTQYGLTYVSGLNFANVSLPVPMRTSPSVSGSTLQWSWQGSGVAITSVAIDKSSPLTPGVQFNTGGGETQYRPGLVVTNNSTSGYLQFSAEL